MYQAYLELPEKWEITKLATDECTVFRISLKSAPSVEKARLAQCLPDVPHQMVDPVGSPGDFDLYQKVRIGEGVVELGLWGAPNDRVSGLLQVDRIAPGKAISTLRFSGFTVNVEELNELIQGLLQSRLVRLDPKRLTGQQREAFDERCSDWQARAKGAVSAEAWRGVDVKLPLRPRPKGRAGQGTRP